MKMILLILALLAILLTYLIWYTPRSKDYMEFCIGSTHHKACIIKEGFIDEENTNIQ